LFVFFFFSWHNSAQWARASSLTRFLDHKQRRTTVGRTLLDEWSAHRRDLYLTTHNTHNTNIHATGRIRTHNLSRRAAADLRLRPRGRWYRLNTSVTVHKHLKFWLSPAKALRRSESYSWVTTNKFLVCDPVMLLEMIKLQDDLAVITSAGLQRLVDGMCCYSVVVWVIVEVSFFVSSCSLYCIKKNSNFGYRIHNCNPHSKAGCEVNMHFRCVAKM